MATLFNMDIPQPKPISQILTEISRQDIGNGDPDKPARFKRADLFALKKHAAWSHKHDARCDFATRPSLHFYFKFYYIAIWSRTIYGPLLDEIKADHPKYVPRFATAAADIIKATLGDNLDKGNFAIITAPVRRHKEHNFASQVSAQIAQSLNIPFIPNALSCRSKNRVNAIFDINTLPPQQNIIVFDDIVTTCSTLKSIYNAISPTGKNLIFLTGILNRK